MAPRRDKKTEVDAFIKREFRQGSAPRLYTREEIFEYPLIIEAVDRAESVTKIAHMFYSCFAKMDTGWSGNELNMVMRTGYFKVYRKWIDIFEKLNMWDTGWVEGELSDRSAIWNDWQDIPFSAPPGMEYSDYIYTGASDDFENRGAYNWLLKNEYEKQRKFVLEMIDLHHSCRVSMCHTGDRLLVEGLTGRGIPTLIGFFLTAIRLEIWYCHLAPFPPLKFLES